MADKRVVEPENLSASADAPEAEGAEQTATTEAKEQLAALTRERDDYYDRLLRKTAEFDNYRKRIDRERREQSDQAVLDLLQELLLVIDDFDLALSVEGAEGTSAYRKGVELIHAKLYDLLKKYGVSTPEMEKVIGGLKDIPVDIWPVFPAAGEK